MIDLTSDLLKKMTKLSIDQIDLMQNSPPRLRNKKCQESLILECEDRTEATGCEDREEFIMNV